MILVVHDPVYFQDVIVAVGIGDERQIIRVVRRSGYALHEGNDDELVELLKLGVANGRTVIDKNTGAVVIRLRRLDPKNARDVGHLVHECVHAATMLFDRIGFPLKAETDEPLAYYVQFLVRSVLARDGKQSGTRKTCRRKK